MLTLIKGYWYYMIAHIKRFWLWVVDDRLITLPRKEGEGIGRYVVWNRFQRAAYHNIRFLLRFIKRLLKQIWHYITYTIIYKKFVVRILYIWSFWNWNGPIWTKEFWYVQYYAVRVWFIDAVSEHQKEWEEMFRKLILFEWQHCIQEPTVNAFTSVYIPMRPDSFADFILIGVTIFLLFTSLIFTHLKWSAVLHNILNTLLQIGWIIIITRMVVIVFWSNHLTMYIMLHPICFSLLLLSRSFANDIVLDDEDFFDVISMWCGYFFIATALWSVDLFFIH